MAYVITAIASRAAMQQAAVIALGMSQRAAARLLGVSQRTIFDSVHARRGSGRRAWEARDEAEKQAAIAAVEEARND